MDYRCKHCIYFLPNTPYPVIGLCNVKKTAAYADAEPCSDFRKATVEDLVEVLKEEGWVYCVTCRKVITTVEELLEHVREHQLSVGTVLDESIREESYPGD